MAAHVSHNDDIYFFAKIPTTSFSACPKSKNNCPKSKKMYPKSKNQYEIIFKADKCLKCEI